MTALTRIAVTAVLAGLIAAPAAAQLDCATHDEAIKNLSDKYGERQVAMGLTSKGSVVEIFVKPDGTSWTIVITYPNGVTCIVEYGQAWEETAPIGSAGA